ncbi:MAG: hypothetical protein ACREBS_08630 [Nitrososphaerales archaeon]
MSRAADESKEEKNKQQLLESRKYHFGVEGTMPVLEFDIASGSSLKNESNIERQKLTLELYNPLSNEIFEARFSKGRIEVDKDGAITYFTTNADQVNVSLFVGRNLTISMGKSGEVLIRSPSKIISVEQNIRSSSKKRSRREVTSDEIKLRLE